jgi:hypothetical protein
LFSYGVRNEAETSSSKGEEDSEWMITGVGAAELWLEVVSIMGAVVGGAEFTFEVDEVTSRVLSAIVSSPCEGLCLTGMSCGGGSGFSPGVVLGTNAGVASLLSGSPIGVTPVAGVKKTSEMGRVSGESGVFATLGVWSKCGRCRGLESSWSMTVRLAEHAEPLTSWRRSKSCADVVIELDKGGSWNCTLFSFVPRSSRSCVFSLVEFSPSSSTSSTSSIAPVPPFFRPCKLANRVKRVGNDNLFVLRGLAGFDRSDCCIGLLVAISVSIC